MSIRILSASLAVLLFPRELDPVAMLDPPEAESTAPHEVAEFVPFPNNWSFLCGERSSLQLDMQIEAAAREFGLEPALLATVVVRESHCNPVALGASGEIGLTQINPHVWRRHLKRHDLIEHTGQLYDPRINLSCAAHILSRHLERSDGDAWTAFRKYNGSGKAARVYADEAFKMYTAFLVDEG